MQQHRTWIHNLLDGELNPHDEPSLFGELSVNTDLRTEFKQQLAIRSAVQHDRMALVPPAHLTNTVFSGLGFAAPMAGAAAGAAGGGFLVPWLLKLGLPILSAAAAVGITMAVSNSPESLQMVNIASPQSQQVTDNSPSEAGPMSEPGAPMTTSSAPSDAENMLAALRRENRRLRGELASAQAQAQTTDQPPPQTPPQPPITPAVPTIASTENETPSERMAPVGISSIDLTNSMTFDNSRDLQSIETQIVPATMLYTPYPSFMLQVRGFAASPLSDVNVPEQSSWYQNVAVAALYQLSTRNTIGAEGGSEAFAQRFEGQNNGQVIRYEQRPSALWLGVLYRHTFGAFGQSSFAPFGQIFAGGTQYGPLGRFTGGIQYSPAEPLSFIVGFEYTMLRYKHQDAWFNSQKLGLTYGMAVRL